MKKRIGIISGLILFFSILSPASAHVTVKPTEVGVAERITFMVSVPTEKEVSTTTVRLLIPEGVKSVRPNVKPGWNIELKKTGEGEAATISEIIWSGGKIPTDQRDEFLFSAQVPANESTLVWKAYQTYADGSEVSWDADAQTIEEYEKENPVTESEHDDTAPKPFSQTSVINDLKSKDTTEEAPLAQSEENPLPLILSIIAVVLSAVTLHRQMNSEK